MLGNPSSPEGPLSASQAALSATVRLQCQDGSMQIVNSAIVEELSEFGEIARLDTGLGGLLGSFLVTYFDVRAAQHLLQDRADQAESFPPAAHDFRSVRVDMAAFAELVGTGGFHRFGEVANISVVNKDAVVEFYDMRSAQALLSTVGRAASPWIPPPSLTAAQPAPPQSVTPSTVASAVANALAAASATQPMPAPSSPLPAGMSQPYPEALSPLARAALAAQEGAYGSPNGAGAVGAAAVGNGLASPNHGYLPAAMEEGDVRRTGRTKVPMKEFEKYDINPEKIIHGEDVRTTVMVRNLNLPTSRKDFMFFLEKSGLSEKYMFFYMPCKEHRNIPAGFAFVNFKTAKNVLTLFEELRGGLWQECSSDPQAKRPAVSYARFQGQEELMNHFSTSAVLHELDPNKRPLFRTEDGRVEELSIGMADTIRENAQASRKLPKQSARGPKPPQAQPQPGFPYSPWSAEDTPSYVPLPASASLQKNRKLMEDAPMLVYAGSDLGKPDMLIGA